MLPGAPWLLAHESMLEVNKPQKFSLYGSDYVLWKDQTGNVSALSNVCPHMGAMLSEGWCAMNQSGSHVEILTVFLILLNLTCPESRRKL